MSVDWWSADLSQKSNSKTLAPLPDRVSHPAGRNGNTWLGTTQILYPVPGLPVRCARHRLTLLLLLSAVRAENETKSERADIILILALPLVLYFTLPENVDGFIYLRNRFLNCIFGVSILATPLENHSSYRSREVLCNLQEK